MRYRNPLRKLCLSLRADVETNRGRFPIAANRLAQHDDTGCAVANAYCALEAGATHGKVLLPYPSKVAYTNDQIVDTSVLGTSSWLAVTSCAVETGPNSTTLILGPWLLT